MRKVCEVYLVSSASSDERGVELTFPVSRYEMMDAFEQIHTKSPGDVYWQVDEFYCFDYLAPHLDESMSIFEFNSLTEQLSKLDSYQETALEGLLQMQVNKHMQENSRSGFACNGSTTAGGAGRTRRAGMVRRTVHRLRRHRAAAEHLADRRGRPSANQRAGTIPSGAESQWTAYKIQGRSQCDAV